MSEQDLETLLGGFAADTLTQEERRKLFTAALQDQQLFNALADEQALKELLADPAVRGKLLASLKQRTPSSVGGSLSWLDWFKRPVGLAFAGSLTVAALAVVLGVRIYQDSLKQAAQSVAMEEAKTAAPAVSTAPASQPQVTEPQAKAKEHTEPAITAAKKDMLADKMAKRERVASATDQKASASAAPPAAPAPAQAPANSPSAGAIAPAVSARTLFYGGEAARPDGRAMAQEKERATTALAESAPQSNRLERKLDQSSLRGKAADTATQLKPLGLRYSLVVRGADGQDREVDAATANKNAAPVRLTLETNQTAYLQVWQTVGSATPQLLRPEKDTGQISLKIAAGQRQQISLPTDSGPLTLTVRLSLVPFGPITRQEAAMFDRLSPSQLQESITTSGPTGSQEQATYVVNQDPAPTAQISVEISLSR